MVATVSFVAAFTCMDWRLAEAVNCWSRENLGIETYKITAPGMHGVLAGVSTRSSPLRRDVAIHDYNVLNDLTPVDIVLVVGHNNCKGCPNEDSAHKRIITSAVQYVIQQINPKTIIGLFVGNCLADDWRQRTVEVVFDSRKQDDLNVAKAAE